MDLSIITDLESERDKYKNILSNILAFIFRDGGQYEVKNGVEAAMIGAEKAIRKERAAHEDCIRENRRLKMKYSALFRDAKSVWDTIPADHDGEGARIHAKALNNLNKLLSYIESEVMSIEEKD